MTLRIVQQPFVPFGSRRIRSTRFRFVVLAWTLCSFILAQFAQAEGGRAEVGALVSQTYLPVHPVGSVQYQPAIGAVGSIRLCKRLDFDAAADITPSRPITSTSFAGGRLIQAYWGVRTGYSKGRTSVYGKLRPGLVSFGEAILQVSPLGVLRVGRLTEPSVDVGAILDIRISRRFTMRYDVGDSIIDYRARVIQLGNTPTRNHVVNNLQVGSGFLFRF